MPKNVEDMIVPERKKSIRNIPIPSRRSSTVSNEPRNNSDQDVFKKAPGDPYPFSVNSGNNLNNTPPPTPPLKTRGSRRPRRGLWMSVGVSLVVLTFAFLTLFHKATLSYVPQFSPVSFTGEVYTAQKTGGEGLFYSVVKLSLDRGVQVSSSGEVDVSRKATGQIVVFNETPRSINLRDTTRFETSDGKVYQVADRITVPARTVVDGEEVPGSLEIIVAAENPGAEYNTGLSDFTLPGLSESSLFSSVYARSKTEISGGFVGKEKVVSEGDKRNAETNLESSLREALFLEARAQVPEGFILLEALSFISFESLPQTSAEDGTALINIRGNLTGVMFKEDDLFTHLTEEKLSLEEGQLIDIVPLESLTFSLKDIDSSELSLLDEMSFSVVGSAQALWRTDELALKADLAGKSKSNLSSVLNNYPTVTSATAQIQPFWRRSFPSDAGDITVEQVTGN